MPDRRARNAAPVWQTKRLEAFEGTEQQFADHFGGDVGRIIWRAVPSVATAAGSAVVSPPLSLLSQTRAGSVEMQPLKALTRSEGEVQCEAEAVNTGRTLPHSTCNTGSGQQAQMGNVRPGSTVSIGQRLPFRMSFICGILVFNCLFSILF